MKKQILAFLFINIIATTAHAQPPAWQWLKSGGSAGVSTFDLIESCKNIYTDDNGNIYGISTVLSSYVHVDTIVKLQGFGYDDFCVFSYRCDGSFRWARFFGSPLPDVPGGIVVDNTGNVYVAGQVCAGMHGDAYFGDTIIPQTSQMNKASFVAKLDSSGHTVWLSLPELPFDNVGNVIQGIEADNQGNLCVLTKFTGPTKWDSIVIPQGGWYIAKFDKTHGGLLAVTKLEYNPNQIGKEGLYFTIDSDNSIYLFSDVGDTVIVGNDTIATNYPASPAIYKTLLVKYSPAGNKIWHTEVGGTIGSTTDFYKRIWGKPLIFGNYVYIGGETQSYPGTSFFGVPIVNSLRSKPIDYNDYTKLIARFHKNTGSFVSAINLNHNSYAGFPPLGKTKNGILLASSSNMVVLNQSDTVKPVPPPYKNYLFIVEADTALAHFNWGVATEAAGLQRIDAITVDKRGNIYVAGNHNANLYNSFGQVTYPAAGNEDFFIAKIAEDNYSCGCKYALPSPQMVSLYDKTLSVKGSATNTPDSLYWYWGDGERSLYTAMNSNMSHTYPGNGNYTVCLRAWNLCGAADSCLQVSVTGIDQLEARQPLTMQPNPFDNTLTITLPEYLEKAEVQLFDMVGKQAMQATFNGSEVLLNTGELHKGVYFVRVVSSKGMLFRGKAVKN